MNCNVLGGEWEREGKRKPFISLSRRSFPRVKVKTITFAPCFINYIFGNLEVHQIFINIFGLYSHLAMKYAFN